jgi:hypothetical protein
MGEKTVTDADNLGPYVDQPNSVTSSVSVPLDVDRSDKQREPTNSEIAGQNTYPQVMQPASEVRAGLRHQP